ncbi:cupin domain-containing carboxymuconolactone decarboxylase family protein [Helicobacter heilmannii]|uniref:4-carboxymuconolactone decarboxylase n=1 Tax=Helicobacter heilmannii TaxID=35817 RepID=A0A0K2Y708_HELHE|nr:carboxymuconolactone decarboxylase family protein [Helicobacter heilmannii]BDQ26553.1 4-carboxymuconolactone decarboxylase [Helicobacter heilmannii]CCM11530.1 4-carboxymuconolactone decarboxylase [Helicobacter heilmannii ASB1.4]CRI34951.1 4-carboxymuconolactone decarboxylase [Helicobacter heilmannii]
MQEVHRQAEFQEFQGTSDKFSGNVRIQILFGPNQWRNFGGGIVHFSPKARSAWHTHPAGQTLLVTEGTIYTGTADGKVSVAHKGDVISCPPGVKHWHGAGTHTSGAHLALTGDKNGENVKWLEKVSDTEYNKATNSLKPAKSAFNPFANSPLKSDSHMYHTFNHFAMQEAFKTSGLGVPEYSQILLASLVALGSVPAYADMLESALEHQVSPVAVQEILYQAIPYVGFARVQDFLETTNHVFQTRGIHLDSQKGLLHTQRAQRGLAIQKEIFGQVIDHMNANAPKDEAHIYQFLSANCFGDYYTRKGLDLHFRELLTFVYLLSLGGADSQLKAHVQGNINMGNNRHKLISVVTALIPVIGYPKALNALKAIDTAIPEHKE